MKNIFLIIVCILLFTGGINAATDPADKVLNEQEKGLILASLPDKLPVPIAKKRRVLVYAVTTGYRHKESIPAGKKWFETLGIKTGQFEVVVSDELANFEADQLKTFDAVCFMCTTGEVFYPSQKEVEGRNEEGKKKARETEVRLKENFVQYLKNGGGWIGFHSATDTLHNWPEYVNIAGGLFSGHPWGSGDEIALQVEDPKSPLTRETLKSKRLMFQEEIYQYKMGTFDRNRSHVILSLDWMRTPTTKTIFNRINRPDFDFPISWIHPYGKGRIFYSNLGHNPHTFWHKDLNAYHLRGVLYATGDLPLDATPQGKLVKPTEGIVLAEVAPINETELASSLTTIKDWAFTKAQGVFGCLRNSMNQALQDKKQRPKAVETLLALLKRPSNTLDEKKVFLEMTHWLQEDSFIPVLLQALADPETVYSACYGLAGQKIEPQMAGLKERLKSAPSAAIPQILGYLASPQWKAISGEVAPLLKNENPLIADAALNTLTKMADEKAYEAIAAQWNAVQKVEVKLKLTYALIEVASFLKKYEKSQGEMEKIAKEGAFPEHLRVAAAILYLRAPIFEKNESAATEVAWVKSAIEQPGSPQWHGIMALIQEAKEFPGSLKVRDSINSSFEALPANLKRVVISAYAESSIRDLHQASCVALSQDPTLGPVCAYAAWKSPDRQWITPLIEAAKKLEGQDRNLTIEGLVQMRTVAVEEGLLEAIRQKSDENIEILVEVISNRKMWSAKPILMEWINGAELKAKNAGLKAFAALSSEAEIPQFLNWLTTFDQENQIELVERCIQPLIISGASQETLKSLIESYEKCKGEANKISVVRLLARANNNDAILKLVSIYELDASNKIKRKAVEGLGESKKDETLAILKKIANGTDPALQTLAIRSAGNIIKNVNERPIEQTATLGKEWLSLCKNADHYRGIISGLSEFKGAAIKAILEPLLANAEIKKEVEVALKKVK